MLKKIFFKKLQEITKNTEFFLSDVEGFKRFKASTLNMLKEFKTQKQYYFEDWCDATKANIKDPSSNIRYLRISSKN